MWTDEKQQQLDALREKEFAGTLTAEENQQLEQLFAELDAEEAQAMRPTLEQMEQEHQQRQVEIARLQRKKELLATLAAQEEQLVQRARDVLQEVRSEKARLRAEYERALAEETRVA